MEYNVGQMPAATFPAYLDPFDQIFEKFLQAIRLNFSNNALDLCFKFKNCLQVVTIDLELYKTPDEKKSHGANSDDLNGQLTLVFLEIT